MSEHPQDVALAPAPGSTEPLRVVLFGLPQAGKSALLAALAQAQKEQAAPFDGEVADVSGGLEQQRRLYYDAIPQPTGGQTSPYPVRFRPPGAHKAVAEAWLVDSDGHIAQEMLQRPLPEEDEVPPGTLPRAVLDADALVLVLDATNPDEDLFTEFGDFLARLERARAERGEVTGLPVYAVLTKCDLLARRDEDVVDWINHLEERKRQVGERLRAELDEEGERPHDFGRLDLRLWATATKRPPLTGSPARPREPYGVAELFRQALGEAETFRDRRVRADRRLTWTVRGLGGLAGGLVAMTLVLLTGLFQHHPSELERRIEANRLMEGTDLFDRLNDNLSLLQDRLAELRSFRQDPHFDELPQEVKKYVEDREAELVEYIDYLEEVQGTTFTVIAQNDEELRQQEQKLQKQLPLPHEEWAETGAGLLRQRRLDDLKLLGERANLAEGYYRSLRAHGINLWAFGTTRRTAGLIDWADWLDGVHRFEEEASQLPLSVRVLPAASYVTPSTILEFDRVHQARALALSTVYELDTLRDIACALGLLEDPLRPDLLVLRASELTAPSVRQRYERLRNHPELLGSLAGLGGSPGMGLVLPATFYPGHPFVSAFPEYLEDFTLARVPQAARPEVQRAASTSYRFLLPPMRERVLEEYRRVRSGGEEKAADWKKVAAWLERGRQAPDTPLRPYRRLALVLARLARPGAEDPLEILARFLERDEFRTTVVGASLTIPSDLSVAPPDQAELVIEHGTRTLKFPLKPEKTPPGGNVYFFEGASQQLDYRLGDSLKASLVLRGNRSFLWKESRTRTYAFECLNNPPLLVDKDQVEVAERAADVVLRLHYDGPGLPDIPEVLPAVPTR
jgi:hypothetical protein